MDLVFYVGLSEVIRRRSLRYLLPAYSVKIWRSLAVEIDINELVLLFKGLLLTEKNSYPKTDCAENHVANFARY